MAEPLPAIFQSLAQYGIAGIILYLIARPLISYLIDSNKAKDEQIKELVFGHLQKAEERHHAMIEMLNNLPGAIVKGISDLYDPALYGKTDNQIKKLRTKKK